MPQVQRELLQEIAIFGALSNDALDFLLHRAEEATYSPGEYVFHERDEASAMFVVKAGKAVVLKYWEGRQYVLDHLQSGCCFGEMALMDMHRRSASVVATEESQILSLGLAALFELHQHDVEQFMLLQMNLGREVSRRLRDANERLFLWRVGSGARRELPVFDGASLRSVPRP